MLKSLPIAFSLLLSLGLCLQVNAVSDSGDPPAVEHATPQKAINLNNEACHEIQKGHFDKAIPILLEALTLDPHYRFGRANLAIVHNNNALRLNNSGDKKGALKEFHIAGFVAPPAERKVNEENIEALLKMMNLDAGKFSDRVKLGDEALKDGDLIGALFEYRAALALQSDPNIKAKLDQAVARLKVTDKLMSEIDSAHL